MKKIINSPEHFVEDTLDGIIMAWGDRLKALNGDKRIIVRNSLPKNGKIGLVSGGGSGHLPVFLGYVGNGMLDGCAVGNVFLSPSSSKIEQLIRACDLGNGVLCIYGNYNGDRLSFELAQETVKKNGLKVDQIIVCDDIASSPKETSDKRRGIAGIVYVYKIAGAAANLGMDFEEVRKLAQRAADNILTLGFATSPCVIPSTGLPKFSIADDEIEIGVGIHGEPGFEHCKMMSATEIAKEALSRITTEMTLCKGDEVSVMVNGLGGTTMEELLVAYKSIHFSLASIGVSIIMPHIGEYATSMEMAGLSITLFKLDKETKQLMFEDASTPFYITSNM